MNRIERYLGGVLIRYSFLVLLVLLLILWFSELMIQLGKIEGDYTLTKGVMFSILKLPVYGYEIFPLAMLIGSLIGLGALANQHELTVLRVTGWSVARIVSGVLKTALMLWVAVAIVGELVAPASEAYATKLRAEALQQNISVGDRSGFWMKDGERFVHVQRWLSTEQMHDVSVYELQSGRLQQVVRAPSAFYEQGEWHLQSGQKQSFAVKDYRFSAHTIPYLNWQHAEFETQAYRFPVTPDLLARLQVDTRYMRIDDLYHYIAFLRDNGLDAAPYELEYWRKLATPVTVVAMLALVFPLLFGSQRQVSMGQRIFVGILIGMGFHLLNQIFGNLSVVYQLAPIWGAFLPSMALLLLALILLRRLT